MSEENKIILGIDPGTIVLGYGIIAVKGQKIDLLSMGVVRLSKHEDGLMRLKIISEKIEAMIKEYKPIATAVEAPFFGKNVQSMLKLGRAQGVAIATSLRSEVPVTEYSPRKIKQSITGSGSASKEQVAAMLQQLCSFQMQPRFLDATDALAAAICHHFQTSNAVAGAAKKTSGWADFIKQNPRRLK